MTPSEPLDIFVGASSLEFLVAASVFSILGLARMEYQKRKRAKRAEPSSKQSTESDTK